jgi:FkbM family methyltransferase
MNNTVRKILTANRLSRRIYCAMREEYHAYRVSRNAEDYFLNPDEFRNALRTHGQGRTEPVDLRTRDGLTISMRPNYGDAMTIAEIFLDDCYGRDLGLPPNPVVMDVGGFIGDFALYAVKRLNARKVIVCEPSPRNWIVLLKNIANNSYQDRIEPVNKAVTADGGSVMMNIDAPDEFQSMVSAHCTSEQSMSAVPGISLGELLRVYSIESVDLLKIDVEGGEYAILEGTPADVFRRIRNIVFEYHDIEGGWAMLESVKRRLSQEGYSLHLQKGLGWASRPS